MLAFIEAHQWEIYLAMAMPFPIIFAWTGVTTSIFQEVLLAESRFLRIYTSVVYFLFTTSLLVAAFVVGPLLIAIQAIEHQAEIIKALSQPKNVPIVLLSAIGLFWAKRRFQMIYGAAEIIVGVASIFIVGLQGNGSDLAKAAAVVGGVYVIIRGLENFEKGLEANGPRKIRGAWRFVFAGNEYEKAELRAQFLRWSMLALGVLALAIQLADRLIPHR